MLRSILFCIIAVIIAVSCNDDPVPFSKPESALYFNATVNNYEKTIIEGQNGYHCIETDSCALTGSGSSLFSKSLLTQKNTGYYMKNNESFGLNIHNINDNGNTDKDAVLLQYFSQGVQFAYIDTTAATANPSGVEVIWIDAGKNYYTTLYTIQGGNFKLDSYAVYYNNGKRRIKLEISLSCNLYSQKTGKTISLTDGTARITFSSVCF